MNSSKPLVAYREETAARLAAEGLSTTEIAKKVGRAADTVETWYRKEEFAARVRYHLDGKLAFSEDLLESSVPQAARVVAGVVAGRVTGKEVGLKYKAALFILARFDKLKVTKPKRGLTSLTPEQIEELDSENE